MDPAENVSYFIFQKIFFFFLLRLQKENSKYLFWFDILKIRVEGCPYNEHKYVHIEHWKKKTKQVQPLR